MELLAKFLENGGLDELLCDESKVLPTVRGYKNLEYDTATQMYWDVLLRRIISLPDKVSNIFKLKERYYHPPLIFISLTSSRNTSLEFRS